LAEKIITVAAVLFEYFPEIKFDLTGSHIGNVTKIGHLSSIIMEIKLLVIFMYIYGNEKK